MNPIWTLWATALALLLIALAGLLWPLLRETTAAPEGRTDIEARLRQLYRAQRDELDRQALPPADHRQAVDELQRRLLDDIDRATAAAPAAAPDGPWRKRMPAAVLSVLLPLGALGLYLQVGDPRAAASLAQSRPDTHAGKGIDADAMVARLAERLRQAPDDLEGWMVLARSREVQEDFAAAAQAYQRAAELAARQQAPAELQARLLADLADALASAHGGALDGPVQAALDAALALHPDQPKALALAGTAAARRGDRDAARRHWGRLLPLLEPDSDIALRLRNGIGSLDGGAAAKESPAPASPY
jgi:cytochrome c-type biogenesis protein CcmH